MDGIGDVLRDAREARGVDLEEVERATKIRGRYLAALEAEEWDVLPGRAYVRGFLRTYAEFLDLDPGPLTEQLQRELEAERPEEAPLEPVVQPGTLPQGRWRGIGLRLAAALVALAAVAAAIAIWIGDGADDPGGATPAAPPAAEEEPAGDDEEPEPEPEPDEPQRVTVAIEATGTVWVCMVSGGGEPLVDGETLAAGDSRGPFEARRVQMTLGNGQAELTANGEAVEVPDAPDPIGLELVGDGVSELDESERPTCA